MKGFLLLIFVPILLVAALAVLKVVPMGYVGVVSVAAVFVAFGIAVFREERQNRR